MNACWNSIGVRGNRSCPQLEQYIHCRNCPVHAAAAVALLENAPPDDYLAGWTTHLAKPEQTAERDAQSVIIFRVGAEWLALPTPVVEEVTHLLPIHSLPHRRRDVVLGVTNVRGELVICVSLGRILGLEESAVPDPAARRAARQRFLVIRGDAVRAACPVHDVHGIHHFPLRDLKDVPATLAMATTPHSKKLLPWRDHSVGVLDAQSLFVTVKRSLA